MSISVNVSADDLAIILYTYRRMLIGLTLFSC